MAAAIGSRSAVLVLCLPSADLLAIVPKIFIIYFTAPAGLSTF